MRTRNLIITLFLSMAALFLCQTGLAAPLFNARFDFEAGDSPYSVALGDLDGDGDLDLAVANHSSDTVSVFLGNGDGTFQSAVDYGVGSMPYSVALGDLNGDGDLDLAVVDGWNVSVFLGNGDGTFQSTVDYGVAYGRGNHSVALGDLDGDGDLDLAVANEGTYFYGIGNGGNVGNVSVLLGNGDGTFRSAVNYGAGDHPCSVALGDLDGDGDPDLAVTNAGSYDYVGSNISVLLGNGDGTFRSAVNYRAGDRPRSVAIGALDGDGVLDLAVANAGSDTVSVLLGNGDGTFRSAVSYGVGDAPRSVAIGALDGDGVLDLAVANAGSYDYVSGISLGSNVSVLLGNSDGTFQSAVNYGAGDGPRSVAIGDLDGDDDLDLAVANWANDNVSVLINSLYSEPAYPKGWSMISLPVDPPDKRLDKLFPDAVVVYGYEKGRGYVRVKSDEDLEVGKGYWILLDKPQPYVKEGTEITEYTIPVADGWYMIGGCSSPAQKMVTNGKIVVIYGYAQGIGYQRVTGHLERGKGYWNLFSNTSEGAEFTAGTSVSE